MPCRRQRSFVSAPASDSLSTPMICSSVNRFPFIELSFPKSMENSKPRSASFRGQGQVPGDNNLASASLPPTVHRSPTSDSLLTRCGRPKHSLARRVSENRSSIIEQKDVTFPRKDPAGGALVGALVAGQRDEQERFFVHAHGEV